MNNDTISTVGKWAVVLSVVGICGYIIATSTDQTNLTQAWGVMLLVIGWIVRDTAGTSATNNAVRIQEATLASQPVQYAATLETTEPEYTPQGARTVSSG